MNLQVRFGQVVRLQNNRKALGNRHAGIQRGTQTRIAIAQVRLASGLFGIVNPTVINGKTTVICLSVNLHKAAIPEDLVI